MVVAEIFARRDQEAAGAAGGIADHVLRTRRHHLDHQRDDVARGAELAVLAGGRDLRQHVFVEVALGVAILHRDFGEEIDHLGQQRRRRNGEARALHMGGVRGVGLGHVAQEREDVLGDDLEHRRRVAVLQPRPAHVLVGDAAVLADLVLARREDAPLDRLAEAIGLVLLAGMRLVEPAHEQEVGDLLDDLERIGDATRPKSVPDVVDLGSKFTCQHISFSNVILCLRLHRPRPCKILLPWAKSSTIHGRGKHNIEEAGVEWYFRDISNDPSEKELTQQDQFNNDEVVLAEALVRETIQNSTDAGISDAVPVRVRFALAHPSTQQSQQFFSALLEGLTPHLQACGIVVPTDPQKFLVIEDFETTGLEGAINLKDNGQFCGFWRRFGRSNKKGSSGGRWGLGKLVFSSSSSIKTLIGLTRRAGKDPLCLMGQAILRNHKIGEIETDSVGFWCTPGAKKGLPSTNSQLCQDFAKATLIHRANQTGLSLVIPYVLPEIEPHHLMLATIKNYYFPILTGRLIVDVNDTKISAETFDQISADLGSEAIAPSVLSFVRQLQSLRTALPPVTLPTIWQSTMITGDVLGEELVTRLRSQFKTGEMLYIRAPLSANLKAEKGRHLKTHVDLFLRPSNPGERSQTLVVRGSITVPTEGKKAQLPDCHAALVADDPVISQLLGDAENPAHTQWNERAEKLRANWVGAHTVLRRIRAVLHEIHAVVADRIERDDPLALLDFFSIPKALPRDRAYKGATDQTKDLPEPRHKPFRIQRRSGGFTLLPNPKAQLDGFPLRIRLRCAYDVLNGNPFRRFSDDDFSFFKERIKIEKHNADCWPTDPNQVDIEARSADFRIEVTGFDVNRDLVVEAQS